MDQMSLSLSLVVWDWMKPSMSLVVLYRMKPSWNLVVRDWIKLSLSLEIVVRMDHASLRCLSFREPEGQVARQLQEYRFSVLHRQRDSHTNADGLSR